MNFDLSPDQKMLADSAAQFAKKESPVARFRKLRDDPVGWEKTVWKQMGELGWLAILMPESLGGFGGTFVDYALVAEQLGATLVPEPLLASCALAATAVLDAGSAAQQEELLAPVAAGDATIALAYAERDARYDAAHVATRARKQGAGYRLDGEKVWVLEGHAADRLVVSARTGGGVGEREGVSLFAVDPKQKGVTVTPVRTMDGHRAAVVRFDGAEVPASALLGHEGGALAAIEHAIDRGAAAACAEGVGNLRASLEMTRDYLCTRKQFGVAIGSFQALQHRLVDMFIEVELAKSTNILAALKVDDADPLERAGAVSAAKAELTMSGKLVSQQAIQLHGGIGVTEEHDIGLYFKRMAVLMSLFGDEAFHLARFSRLPAFVEGVEPLATS
ncbi:MAG TPA: acyl-CoA dehydrogenase [Minicystis sp.]|nr:acyl-CoA dehydrogenase [Minicystis sp.]